MNKQRKPVQAMNNHRRRAQALANMKLDAGYHKQPVPVFATSKHIPS